MLREFTNLWFEARPGVKARLEETQLEHVDTYTKLLHIILQEFNNVIDKDDTKSDSDKFREDIKQIDYGEYQGTLILTFAKDTYQPTAEETFYTYVEYGSCSGCDTLQNIIYSGPYCYMEYSTLNEDEKIEYDNCKKTQIDDLLALCLHMIERITSFNCCV